MALSGAGRFVIGLDVCDAALQKARQVTTDTCVLRRKLTTNNKLVVIKILIPVVVVVAGRGLRERRLLHLGAAGGLPSHLRLHVNTYLSHFVLLLLIILRSRRMLMLCLLISC